MIKNVSPSEASKMLAEDSEAVLIDVREQWEYDIAHIKNSVLIPLHRLKDGMQNLPKEGTKIVMCHHGSRSLLAAAFLVQQGYSPVVNLQGGIDAWSRTVDKNVPRY